MMIRSETIFVTEVYLHSMCDKIDEDKFLCDINNDDLR